MQYVMCVNESIYFYCRNTKVMLSYYPIDARWSDDQTTVLLNFHKDSFILDLRDSEGSLLQKALKLDFSHHIMEVAING